MPSLTDKADPEKLSVVLKKPKIFIVFGMPRTGTTYFYQALGKHPSIYTAYRKESFYFSVNYCRGKEWFYELYKKAPKGLLCADINPMYYLDANSVERIIAYDKDVKVILGVRDPVELALSLYGNMIAHGVKTSSILQMVEKFEWPLTQHTSLSYELGHGFMERRIEELSKVFSHNLLLYDFDDFQNNPLKILQAIELFLDIPPFFNEENYLTERINASGRRNILLLNYIIKNQKVLETLYKILPDHIIRRARSLFEKSSIRSIGKQKPNNGEFDNSNITNSEYESLISFFADDRAYYKKLFAENSILTSNKID